MFKSLADINSILKDSSNLLEVEKRLIFLLTDQFETQVAQALEQADDELIESYDYVKIISKRTRTIQFLFGTVKYRRREVLLADGRHVFPLDECLSLTARKRFSPLFIERISELASHGVYREAARAVELLTTQSISHQQVGEVVRQSGALCANQQAEQLTQQLIGKKKLPYLYIEGDAFMIKIKRRSKKHKTIWVNIHRLQVTEGIQVNGHRHITVGRHICASLNREEAFDQMATYIDQHYDVTDTIVMTGSDNGSGYEPEAFEDLVPTAKRWTHFLDQYHVNKKVHEKLNVFNAKLANQMVKAIREFDLDKIKAVLTTCESIVAAGDDGEQKQKLRENLDDFKGYLDRHLCWMLPAKKRELDPNQVKLGCCETNHRRYTYRLKHQGRSWSMDGLAAMVNIITNDINGDLEAAMLAQQSTQETEQRYGYFVRSLLSAPHQNHEGIQHGTVYNAGSTSSSMGQMNKIYG